jgi:predicted homoserine dehydrogenase-like protein
MFLEELHEREKTGKPIRVAVVGAGSFGVGLIAQLRQMRGVRLALVVDLDLDRCRSALLQAGYAEGEWREVSSPPGDAAWHVAITTSTSLLPESPVDVVVDCTGSPECGARLAHDCLRAGKHVVMVNVEADVVVGPVLRRIAGEAGVVYTTADGDQPSLAAGLVAWLRALGFHVVCAGKGTRLPSPAVVARRLQEEPGLGWSTVAYLDGSKTQIEMASLANITGLQVDTPGFHGPRLTLDEVPDRLVPREHGGLLGASGTADYVNCLGEDDRTDLNPHLCHGVFAVITSDTPATMKLLGNKGCPTSRDGRYALIVRPYHLCGAETPTSIVMAALYGKATGAPLPDPVADVVAVARRPLAAGTLLDGLGGTTVRGMAYPYAQSRADGMLPVGMACGVRLAQPVGEGEIIPYASLEEPGSGFLWQLRRRQDEGT